MLIVLAVIVLLFGANKIPQIARSVGKAGGEFERGKKESREQLEESLNGGDTDE